MTYFKDIKYPCVSSTAPYNISCPKMTAKFTISAHKIGVCMHNQKQVTRNVDARVELFAPKDSVEII